MNMTATPEAVEKLAEADLIDRNAAMARIVELTNKHCNPIGTPYEQGGQDHGNRCYGAIKNLPGAARAVEKPAGADGWAALIAELREGARSSERARIGRGDSRGRWVADLLNRTADALAAAPSPVTEADEILRELVVVQDASDLHDPEEDWTELSARYDTAWTRARAYISKGGA